MKPFNLEEYLKNPSKKVVTRYGKEVRIICADFNNPDYPVIGEIKGCLWPCSFTTNGGLKKGTEQPSYLFFAPEKHYGWLNIYRSDECGFYIRGTSPYESKEKADKVAKANPKTFFTTIKVEWEE